PLLLIGRGRPLIERRLGNDVLLREATGVNACYRNRIRRLQPRQREQNDLFRLGDLFVVGSRGVYEQVDTGVTRNGCSRARAEQQRRCQQQRSSSSGSQRRGWD